MTQEYIMRLFEPVLAEYEAIVRVFNRANPLEPGSALTWQHWDRHRDPAQSFTRYVVEFGSEIGGYGFSVRTDVAANKFRYAIYLLPEWETGALVESFNNYIMEQCLRFAPTALISRAREDESLKQTWLEDNGFRAVMRYPCSTLNVQAFDLSLFADLRARIDAQGLEIISLASLAQRDPEWQRMVYDLEMLLNQDVPRPTDFSPPPFHDYAQTEFEAPEFMPGLWLIAMDGDAYVGMTSLYKPGSDIKVMETGLTGVRRDYRRRGLATALKCQAIELAHDLGTELIVTYNEENNPMYLLNLRLGFQAQPADVDWEKQLEASSFTQE